MMPGRRPDQPGGCDRGDQGIAGHLGRNLLSNLLHMLMRIVLENAGAEKGYLLLASGEDLTLRPRQRGGAEIRVLLAATPRFSELLPHSIVNYVRRTQKGDTGRCLPAKYVFRR